MSSLRRRAKALGLRFYQTTRGEGTYTNLGGFRIIDVRANRVVAGRWFEIGIGGVAVVIRHFEERSAPANSTSKGNQ